MLDQKTSLQQTKAIKFKNGIDTKMALKCHLLSLHSNQSATRQKNPTRIKFLPESQQTVNICMLNRHSSISFDGVKLHFSRESKW